MQLNDNFTAICARFLVTLCHNLRKQQQRFNSLQWKTLLLFLVQKA